MPVFVKTSDKHCQDTFFMLFRVSIQRTAAVSIANHINNGNRKVNLLCLHRLTGEGARGNPAKERHVKRVDEQLPHGVAPANAVVHNKSAKALA
jgi:hypothetical protein